MTNVKFNYKNDKKNREELWRCDSCKSTIDTQSHILWCPSYKELRAGKDINNDKDLVDYILKVITVSPIAIYQERCKITGGILAVDVNVHTSRQTYTITTKKAKCTR